MIQSPLYQEIVQESKREGEIETRLQDIMDILTDRFGSDAEALEVELKAAEFDRLRDLHRFATKCADLEAFRKRLLS
jgi:Mn-dependent DtxR family transcriptional regulator